MKNEKDIWTLSANYLAGEMTADESIQFEQMLEENPDLKVEFKNINTSWENYGPEKLNESKESWDKLKSRLYEDGLIEPSTKRINSMSYYITRIAALIVIGLILGITFRYINTKENLSIFNATHLSAVENINSYNLPDGSLISLNKGSRLTYFDDFQVNRRVKLHGEGFFEVMSDPENPFEIETKDAIIRVLGTKFNVKETNNNTEVFVESGKVQLKKDLNSSGIVMTNGDFGSSDGKTESLKLNTNINYLSWKTREFEFSDNSLREVISVLENSYHIKININSEGINDLKLTSTYSQQSIDAILQTICMAFDLSCSNTKNVYSLTKN